MHEISIARGLLREVRTALPPDTRLVCVHVDVGIFEHLDESALQLAWEALTEGSDQAVSRVKLHRVPLVVHCGACGCEYGPVDLASLLCPSCGVSRPVVEQGTGVVLTSLDVEPLYAALTSQEA